VKDYLTCWISAARTLFSQALAGEPQLSEAQEISFTTLAGVAFVNALSGQVEGRFTVVLDPGVLKVPLLGEGVEQSAAWEELLREVAEAAAGELLARTGLSCRLDSLGRTEDVGGRATTVLRLTTHEHDWNVMVCDELKRADEQTDPAVQSKVQTEELRKRGSAGVDLLLDVELEASLRFGSREMSLGEVLELGPGDIVELDRHVSDPVDLIVGDKIVAKGDVVLVNGNFGLRVIEVAAPKRRLESIRCLF
jgi:flagellar motor switch protein FliN